MHRRKTSPLLNWTRLENFRKSSSKSLNPHRCRIRWLSPVPGARAATPHRFRSLTFKRVPLLPEQTALPDVPPHHLHASMPGLIHDGPHRSSANCRRGGVPGPQGVPGILAASSPARFASFFTTRATSIPDNQTACTCPCRLIDRKTGPPSMPADSNLGVHAYRASLRIRAVTLALTDATSHSRQTQHQPSKTG